MANDPPDELNAVSTRDEWRVQLSGQEIGLLTGQRGGLISTTRYLYDQWRTATDEQQRHHLAIATTLVAHAAIEATMNEWAHAHANDLYEQHASTGVVRRAEIFFARIGAAVPDQLANLSTAKNALGHSEPDNTRTATVGNWIAGDGPDRAVQVVHEIDAALFGH